MTYAKKSIINELETAWLNHKVNIPENITRDELDLPVEVFIYAFAQLKRRDMTLPEVLATKSFEDFNLNDWNTRCHIEGFYMVWRDMDSLIAREDNVLTSDVANDWKAGYQLACAKYILENGKVMVLNPDIFVWEDVFFFQKSNKNLLETPVGVYNVQEDYWDEFEGTGHTAFSQGMIADVLYASGVSRKVRVEGELGDIIRQITKK